MIQIKGISHITFICQDIEKSVTLFKGIFDAEEIYASGDRTFSVAREIFLKVAGIWIALMEGDAVEKTYNHLAFQVNESDLPEFENRIRKFGLVILPDRKRERPEGSSIYFYDYDNHLFELHTGNLNSRLKFYGEKSGA